MQEQTKRLYAHRTPSTVKGVACYNGRHEFSDGAVYEGGITLEYKWDIYHTT